MDAELVAGYEHVRRGTAAYRGVLRPATGGTPVWRCRCEPVHLNTITARRCAEKELDRRRQGGRQVFELLRCEPCGRWFAAVPRAPACPVCGVPLQRLKVLVLERGPA